MHLHVVRGGGREGDREREGGRSREGGREIERGREGDREREGGRSREGGREIERGREGDQEREGGRSREVEREGGRDGGIWELGRERDGCISCTLLCTRGRDRETERGRVGGREVGRNRIQACMHQLPFAMWRMEGGDLIIILALPPRGFIFLPLHTVT